jgi:hypothetical protein
MSDTESDSTEEGKVDVPKTKSRAAYIVWVVGVLLSVGFTLLIWYLGPLLDRFVPLPDQGSDWYFWQLPERGFFTMLIVWTLYLAHQFSLWATIHWGRQNLKTLRITPTSGLTRYNYGAIGLNVVFVILHLVQTHIWYDGLAQDVPIWTSQGSVIVMLAVLLVMENPVRGFFLGKRAGKPFTARVSGFFRRNHSYIFSWALVYTFWFHPATYDPQLLTGFLYMMLLFVQISLAYTKVHLDRRWTVFLEAAVAPHAVVVAIFNTQFFGSANLWPMFLSGFLFLFVFTYMYAFRLRVDLRIGVTSLYLAFLAWLYLPGPIGYARNLEYLFRLEFLWIPLALYALACLFAGLAYLYLKLRESVDQQVYASTV